MIQDALSVSLSACITCITSTTNDEITSLFGKIARTDLLHQYNITINLNKENLIVPIE